jgi:hypothetical protein
MKELADLLQQSHQLTERIRVLSEEHQALRRRYSWLTKDRNEPALNETPAAQQHMRRAECILLFEFAS